MDMLRNIKRAAVQKALQAVSFRWWLGAVEQLDARDGQLDVLSPRPSYLSESDPAEGVPVLLWPRPVEFPLPSRGLTRLAPLRSAPLRRLRMRSSPPWWCAATPAA